MAYTRHGRHLDWIEKAKDLVRKYVSNEYTLAPDAKLDFDLTISWTVVTPVIKKVLFWTSIDDIRYMVTFTDVTGVGIPGDEEIIVQPIYSTTSDIGPAI